MHSTMQGGRQAWPRGHRFLTVPTLFESSASAFCHAAHPHLVDHAEDVTDYLQRLPGPLKNVISSRLCSMFLLDMRGSLERSEATVGGQATVGARWPTVALVRGCAFAGVTKLDFSGLKQVTFYPATYVMSFKSELLAAIPQLPTLVSLDVSTIRRPIHLDQRGLIHARRSRKRRNGSGKSSTNSLPAIDDDHLRALGRHCHELEELNVSHNRVTCTGLAHLAPDGDGEEQRSGCPSLQRLHVFDCLLDFRELANVVARLAPSLTFLGYKETGRVIKHLHDRHQPRPTLRLTHVNNMGSKSKKNLVLSGLRCRRPMTEAIAAVSPHVKNVKLRVIDADVEHLISL
jgi:hypothetical protein